MLVRQRTFLCLLQAAGGSLGHLRATKLAFELRHGTPSRGGDTFYDFLPYKYGPFSFSLFQEAAKMHSRGLLVENGKRWELTREGSEQIGKLPRDVEMDLHRVMDRFGHLAHDELLKSVYSRYPWFTILSELSRRADRPMAEPAAYTSGYEGLSIDAFLNRILENGIERLIDVRSNPVARRYGFHRRTLENLCQKIGVEYRHYPRLGISSDDRRDLDTLEQYDLVFAEYERRIDAHEHALVEEITGLVESKPSVLVCMEANPLLCHRTRLAQRIHQQTSLPVRDLGIQ